MAYESSICMTGTPGQLAQAVWNHSTMHLTGYVECSIALSATIRIASQGVTCLTADLFSASKSQARRPTSEPLSQMLQQAPVSQKNAIFASLGKDSMNTMAGMMQQSAVLDAAFSLSSVIKAGSLPSRAEAVHFGASLSLSKGMANATFVNTTLGVSCLESFGLIVGVAMGTLKDLRIEVDDMPALELIWQPLNLQKLEPMKPYHWLVLSQAGVCIEDYFDM